MTQTATDLARAWDLDPEVTFLNHGSFGATPRAVLEHQADLVRRMEAEPVRFLVRELETLLDASRAELAAFVGARPEDLAFVANATAAVNTVLRSTKLSWGDELLVTDHAYNACRNALDVVASAHGARVMVARIPFPVASEDDVVAAIVGLATSRTRLALVEPVTSPTGLVLPVARIVSELQQRGVDVLVDGAHAVGMLDLDLDALGAAYYTSNCHKWLCTPKGSAFLHVRRDRQGDVRPLVISHGANSPRTDRSRFRVEFDWIGTVDPTPYLCVGPGITFMGGLVAGGWPEIRRRNRALALAARELLCDALAVEAPSPDSMIGSLAAVPLADGETRPVSPLFIDALQDELWERHRIEVPIQHWPAWPSRLLRVSAQLYNDLPQYERLASLLAGSGPRRASGA